MADLAKIILPSGDEYNFKDAQAREHIQDTSNPHQVTAEQAGAISKKWDYSFRNVPGWYRVLTFSVPIGTSRNILLLVQDTYSATKGGYNALVSVYVNRTSSGAYSSTYSLSFANAFTDEDFCFYYDSDSNTVSMYVRKYTNNNGYISLTVISSQNRAGGYFDLSESFENVSVGTLPGNAQYVCLSDAFLSTVINKGEIESSTDINTLTIPGMWYSATGLQTNWPSQGKPGRLVVFGSNSTTKARKVQLVVCNTNAIDNAELYYRIGIDAIGTAWGSWTCVATKAKIGTITFSLSWNTQPIEPGDEGHVPYEQIVTVTGVTITANSLISLQPTVSQLMKLMEDGVKAITIENDNGTLTAYALGAMPSTAMTVQCSVEETV